METNDVRSDAELLTAMGNEAPIVLDRVTGRTTTLSRKTIARWTGLSVQTLSDYEGGHRNIPVGFWRAILAHYFDPRIAAMLFPDNYDIEITPPGIGEPDTAPGFFRLAVEEMGAYHDKQTSLAEVLADGHVDELDEHSVQEFDDAYLRQRMLGARMHRSIVYAYRQAMAKKERVV